MLHRRTKKVTSIWTGQIAGLKNNSYAYVHTRICIYMPGFFSSCEWWRWKLERNDVVIIIKMEWRKGLGHQKKTKSWFATSNSTAVAPGVVFPNMLVSFFFFFFWLLFCIENRDKEMELFFFIRSTSMWEKL